MGTLPLSDAFSLYGRLGIAQTRASSAYTAALGSNNQSLDLGSATRNAATFGVGGLYNVSQAIGIRLAWDRHATAVNDTDDGVTFYKRNFNVNVYSLGAVFKF